MSRFEIRYKEYQENPPLVERVAFAIAPVDRFTGAIVRRRVSAEIKALGASARRNLSGLLVFVDLEKQDERVERDEYEVLIRAQGAGFFDVTEKFPRLPDEATDIDRLKLVHLHRLPTADFATETTLIRGVVHHNGKPIEEAMIDAIDAKPGPDPGPQPGDTLPYETLSDQRGSFALPLRLPNLTPGQSEAPPVDFWFRFRKEDLPEKKLKQPVSDGDRKSFELPIDLEDDSQTDVVLLPSSL